MPAATSPSPIELLDFWRAAGSKRWFRSDAALDAEFRRRFLAQHTAAASGALDAWFATAQGALALVLLLDQFPRNAFRDAPGMYATDREARAAARAAIAAGHDRQVDTELRQFFYLPFMHSETPADLACCEQLMESLGGDSLRYARHHRNIVARFGRFPHRNRVLGRRSTPEELQFLAEGGFGG